MKINSGDKNSPEKKSKLWLFLFIVFAVIAASCIGVFVYHKLQEKEIGKIINGAKHPNETDITITDTIPESLPETEPSQNVTDEFSSDISEEISLIGFDLLRQSAPDVYAWIQIPGTKLDYPIVRREGDNNYYLRRSILGKYDVTGCVFSEDYNSADFGDSNTLIYGHYMSDGTKFGSLLKYMDRDYFDSYREIVVYTDTHKLEYKVFAAVPFDTRHVLLSYEAYENGFEMFLDDVLSSPDPRSNFADDVSVDPAKDRIITLSTCLKTNTKRYLVLAVLTRSQYCE